MVNYQATMLEPGKTAASHTYDHCKERWDNFDIDAALAGVDAGPVATTPHCKPQLVPNVVRPPIIPWTSVSVHSVARLINLLRFFLHFMSKSNC